MASAGDDDEVTPSGPLLLAACKRGQLSLLRMLIKEHGDKLDVNFQDGLGNAGVHYLSQGNHPEILELLLTTYSPKGDQELKMSLDLQNKKGDTAMHVAVQNGRRQIMEMMIEHGADCSLKNERGVDAAAFAKTQEERSMLHGATVAAKMAAEPKKEASATAGVGGASAAAAAAAGAAEKPAEKLPAFVMNAQLDPDMIADDDDDDDDDSDE